MNRRTFLLSTAASATTVWAGCGAYPAEEGVAFAPWNLDDFADDPPEIQAVRAAILASSPHNTQPWRFTITPERIELFVEPTRTLGAMDPLGRERFIGLGCALENLVLTAEHFGRRTTVTLEDTGDRVATIDLAAADTRSDPLVHAIPHRHTSRSRYAETSLPAGVEEALRGQLDEDAPVRLTFLTDATDMASFREGTIAATRAIVADDVMNEASHAWYRHSRDDIERHRDGTTLDATGRGATIRFLGKITSRPDARTAGDYWIASTESGQTTASAFVILSAGPLEDRRAQLAAGRAYQRLALFAAQEGLAMQPLNQMAERRDRERELGLEPVFGDRLAVLDGGERDAQMLFRIGYAWDEAKLSPRRPLEWVTA